ncbi:glycosyl transferase group 1 [Colletotrichum graminicola]|uniref:alpha-1,3-glucan synthase n=1 Tax=Colletotrichum graminicola (strain M1.001 / M2 / FGSC 10212) TaxID=645133 RepID=E3QMG0_COLGM|nr:glycosyl transferase group 1 [Colletotrichum graminicola M1.001]EFQ32048.1 glycosyl transferase group 1 [Colletotrichum graminicola M1.001]WDK17070.1 glycosyl transferase group 1 [Colletotrichum graminicola]
MAFSILLLVVAGLARALRYDPAFEEWNLNTNQQATNPLDYTGTRPGHDYTASPDNWRFPFYTVMLDRWVNGDPSNDNANGTLFEQDILGTQLRNGGDVQGLVDSLDYIQGFGIRGIYLAGSPFINQPWGYDMYSPLDLTLLDAHLGNITIWQNAIDEIHARGMYVIMDNTMATMGDLIGFEDHLNVSAPFEEGEYKALWKTERQYHDFEFGNDYNETCEYPRFWGAAGDRVPAADITALKGCFNSDFDQYGDVEAFGFHPDWKRQLSKFASVQDRLREWVPSVRKRLEVLSCLQITMLDIDGFRFDKAAQVTVDAQGNFSAAMRECAAGVGKKDFFLPGEITAGNNLGSIYLGRGLEADSKFIQLDEALNATGNDSRYIRDPGQNALDASAFHYSVFRFLVRFLGISGPSLESGYDVPTDWVSMVNQMLLTNDLVNPNNERVDPRHMYGVTNQDNFRWPALSQGIERELLGFFMTTLFMPGIPLLYYGQEQGLYVLTSTAENYVYGRQPMTPAPSSMLHGCYALGASSYVDFPLGPARNGCEDEGVSRDHRDPSHPMRNILRAMYAMRENYPTLSEGWLIQPLANQTEYRLLNGSSVPTEFGIWSVARALYPGFVQDQFAKDPVWFIYHNENETTEYSFDCSNNLTGFFAPFDSGSTVKNLFYPHDELTLASSPQFLGFDGSEKASGCISDIILDPFEYRAYVPKAQWKEAPPMITKFTPGHDMSIDSADYQGAANISFSFSQEMDCDALTKAISVTSTVEGNGGDATVDETSVQCTKLTEDEKPPYIGAIGSKWRWTATLRNLADGVHSIKVVNASAVAGASTGSTDKFLLRVGAPGNPIAFPISAKYSNTLLTKSDSDLFVNHQAAGASSWRYSTNWGSSWSDWTPYAGGKDKIDRLPWTGTALQSWSGDHVMVQYWSAPLGSSSLMQEGDVWSDTGKVKRETGITSTKARRFPHVFVQGDFNQFGFDAGINNKMTQHSTDDGIWEMHLMAEWPESLQLNIWGINPDGRPDATYVLGDVNGDGVGDRLPPNAVQANFFNASVPPPGSALSYKLRFDDATLKFELVPQGNWRQQLLLFILLATVPIVTGLAVVWIFMGSFYKVKINKVGFKRRSRSPFGRAANHLSTLSFDDFRKRDVAEMSNYGGVGAVTKRRTVLIATMEYNIDDWNIKIKIGGLGVMAQLMGKALEHQDLVWVVPCVGGIDYPVDERASAMYPVIMGREYEVQVQYHKVKNITYVLLDAPVFRKCSKADPYPPRMDDMDSAVYYSAWNYCIAETTKRFPIDLYHINDYHGAAAPLYLLPERTIPCALSLHNAEFQGLWPMRTPAEFAEVASVFNLDPAIVKEYVQFGSVFNLLHAGASYLRLHQRGFGAVGVSKKYGDRSFARYPIFWGLPKIGQLPNPDPADTADWSLEETAPDRGGNQAVEVDEGKESKRGELRKQAQEWAGLDVNPDAELFVFVGRWSLQKGVDLIADIFPSILEKYPNTQLIAVGPCIDLYGRFAALKLEKLALMYPGRVYSKPEFTALPPYVFSGAEFALIPSRDEPFGLVAVEFGSKGALGVGARVGGLGQMPGFWYTIESTATSHLLHQFRSSIVAALGCKRTTRVLMRAWSAKQRFPVKQWLEDLETLQSEAIRLHNKEASKKKRSTHKPLLTVPARGRGFNSAEASPRSSLSSFLSRPSSPAGTLDRRRSRESTLYRDSPPGSRLRTARTPSPYLELPLVAADIRTRARSASQPPELRVDGPAAGQDVEDGLLLVPPNPLDANSNPFYTGIGNNSSSDSLSTMMARDNGTPGSNPSGLRLAPMQHRNSSLLSVNEVVGARNDYALQKVDPFFNDSTDEYYRAFEEKLSGLTAKNSESELCIEEYLVESERDWSKRFRDAKLGRSKSPRGRTGMMDGSGRPGHSRNSSYNSIAPSEADSGDDGNYPAGEDPSDDEFLLGKAYKAPTGLKKLLQIRLGDWPIYSFFLALGQILSANSYQIVLLTGSTTQSENKLYLIASVYLGTSIFWWIIFRRFSALYTLTLPFLLYGLGFLLLGISPFIPLHGGRGAVQVVATCLYAAASSTGSLYFAVNFGDEGGAPINIWLFRACIIQGIQQLYTVGLWYWGSVIAGAPVPVVLVIAVPIALMLWAVGLALFFGLPDYYRQAPGYIPSFYASLIRRNIVPWFFLTVVVQNYWLSAPYGRNWQFLFASKYVPGWSAVLLAVGFFVGVWTLLLVALSRFSVTHPWLVPMFSVGLGAPRWAQMLWGTSGIGLYLPWLGHNAVASALLSRALWLWLGVLDTIQGVGIGMVLLLTLTRQHVAAALVGAQILGSVATILARATAPDKIGPGDVFPDFSEGIMPGVSRAWFWVALGLQLVLPFGYFKFFRKEQVSKP